MEQSTSNGWICPNCETQNTDELCVVCGTKRPEPIIEENGNSSNSNSEKNGLKGIIWIWMILGIAAFCTVVAYVLFETGVFAIAGDTAAIVVNGVPYSWPGQEWILQKREAKKKKLLDDIIYEDGKMANGFITRYDTAYYCVDGQIQTGPCIIGEKVWVFDENGQAHNGWYCHGEDTYYCVEGVSQTGWQTIERDTLFFDSYGILADGWTDTEEGRKCFQDGHPIIGWKTIDDSTYYFAEPGVPVCEPSYIGEVLYVFDTDGRLSRNEVLRFEEKTYYSNANGVCEKYSHPITVPNSSSEMFDTGTWNVSITEFDKPIYDCCELTLHLSISDTENISLEELEGRWALFLRNSADGKWVQGKVFTMQASSMTRKFHFRPPVSFDAFYCLFMDDVPGGITIWQNEYLENIKVVEYVRGRP